MLTESTYGLSRPRPVASSGAGPAYLDGVLASTVFDLDATIAASYSGSGTNWANLVAAPADASAQTAYDFTSSGMTFTGSVGDAAAYWSVDATTSAFTLASGVNTDFLNNLHKSSGVGDYWFAMTFQRPAISGSEYFFGTANTGTAETGVNLRFASSGGTVSYRQRDSVSGVILATSTGTVPLSTPSVVIVSHSYSAHNTRIWINSGTAENLAHIFVTSAGNAARAAQISTRSTTSNGMQPSTRWYSFAMGNEYLDNTQAAAIIAHLNTRHSRTYA